MRPFTLPPKTLDRAPSVPVSTAAVLLESDRVYFELGSQVTAIGSGRLVWMPTAAETPAGCLYQRIDPQVACVSANRIHRWLGRIEGAFKRHGNPRVRLYTHSRELIAEQLVQRGYSCREEIGFVRHNPSEDPTSDIELQLVTSEADWESKLQLHARSQQYPDGHSYLPEAWVGIERTKCKTGRMQCYLIWHQGALCGAIGVVRVANLLRLKNLVLHPDYRGRGIAGKTLRHVFSEFSGEDVAAIGAFGISGGAGERLYRAQGMEVVCQQYEWTRRVG